MLVLPAVALLLFSLPMALRSAPPTLLLACQQAVTGGTELTVTATSSTSIDLSWSRENPSYAVKVTDLTTSTVVRSFSTSGKYASVTGLTAGHTYRFSVDSNGYVIAEDVVV